MSREAALRERFLEVARLAADAMLLVVDGVVVAANGATRERLWFVPGPLEGRCLAELAVDPPLATEYLRRCARSAEPVPGAIVFSWRPIGSVTIQSWGTCFAGTAGGLVSSPRGASGPAVALRLESEGPASERCLRLDQKIDELRREIRRRIATESALRESQERLRIILSSIGDAVIATGADGSVAFMNPVAEALTGWREDQARARPLAEIFRIAHAETLEPAPSPIEQVRREHGVVATADPTLLCTREGGQILIEESAAPLDGRSTPPNGIVLVFREVAERRRSEREALLRKEQAARLAAERAAARIAELQALTSALSRSRGVAEVARAALAGGTAALGARAAAIYLLRSDGATLDLADQIGIPADALPAIRSLSASDSRPVATAARTGQAEWTEGEDELLVGAGLAAALALPLHLHGRAIGAMLLGFHVQRLLSDDDRAFALTVADQCAQALERARLYETEAEARALAEGANRAKDEFLSMLSHELRTPLTAILGWANVLRTRRPEPATVTRALEAIDRNARRQTRIIEDILDVGMIVADKMQLDVRLVDPAAVARSAVDAVRSSAEAKRIALKAMIDGEVGMVRGDPGRLEQVAMHLLSNAIKFSPEGGLVAVDLFRQGQRVHLRVSDTGIGIAPDFLPHVFERFRQADSSNTRAYGGLGLGLSIVEHLVELHEGTVTAESEGVGFGAVFTVSLPSAQLTSSSEPTP